MDGTGGIAIATRSESLFEDYCHGNHIQCERIRESAVRTPDFAIRLHDSDVVCEIKQLNLGKRERDALAQALENGSGAYGVPHRLRRKLKNVSGQLKNVSSASIPTILVVFDNTPFRTELEHATVVQALYGTIGYPIRMSADSEPVAGDPFLAGDRGFTSTQNTAVSALAVLEELDGTSRLRVYHNLYAAVPLDPQLFQGLPVEQKVLPGDTSIEVDA